jgi:hypothetical protein
MVWFGLVGLFMGLGGFGMGDGNQQDLSFRTTGATRRRDDSIFMAHLDKVSGLHSNTRRKGKKSARKICNFIRARAAIGEGGWAKRRNYGLPPWSYDMGFETLWAEAKHQAPNRHANLGHFAPRKTGSRPESPAWQLKFGASLVLGAWRLELLHCLTPPKTAENPSEVVAQRTGGIRGEGERPTKSPIIPPLFHRD